MSSPSLAPDLAEPCGILAHACVSLTLSEIRTQKHQMTLFGEPIFAKSFLKPSDEQTVVGLAAVFRAIEQFELRDRNFEEWGVVAAPSFFGRRNTTDIIDKFQANGVWKVSPLFVPHHSLHALSGTISQALEIRGPNIGVGGGPLAFAEGLTSGLTMLATQDVPGVWVVMTCCTPDWHDFREASEEEPMVCHGLALALAPEHENAAATLRVGQSEKPANEISDQGFERLADYFRIPDPVSTWTFRLPWDASIEIVWSAANEMGDTTPKAAA